MTKSQAAKIWWFGYTAGQAQGRALSKMADEASRAGADTAVVVALLTRAFQASKGRGRFRVPQKRG